MSKEMDKEFNLYELNIDNITPKVNSEIQTDEDSDASLTVQDICVMLREKREEILQHTEIEAYGYSIDEWIEYPESIMNLDSGLAYDVARLLEITVDDIVAAIQRESMLVL